MANITKRKGSYLIRCSAGYDITGKQIIKSMTWNIPEGMSEKKAEKEAHHQAALFEEAVRNDEYMAGKIKFKDFAERWFKDYAELQLRIRTVARYKDHMKRINSAIGHIPIGKIRPYHLMEFYNNLSKPIITKRYKIAVDFKLLLKNRGLTQIACSNKCGISLDCVKRLCAGKDVSYDNAKKVAETLKISLKNSFDIVESSKQLSDKTIQNYHRLISSILSWAVKWQVISSNPASRLPAPKSRKKQAIYLDDVQAIQMLELLQGEPIQFRTAIQMLLHTGMRRGELIGLKWSDVDFDNATISIQRSVLYEPKRGIFTDDTKNESSVRVIKTSNEVIRQLRQYKAYQSEQRLQLGDAWHDEDWIFTKWNGKAMNPNDLTINFKKFISKYDLPPIHLHSLRHTNATLLIASGTNIQTVANRLGHTDATTTARIYSHAIKSADAAAAETLGTILEKNKSIMNK